MAYKINRSAACRIQETVEISKSDGSPGLSVTVDIDGVNLAMRVYNQYQAMALAYNEYKKSGTSDGLEAVGRSIICLFDGIFGESQTEEIVKFYDNSYFEMLEDFFPFITEVIIPAVEKASKERKEKLTRMNASYKPPVKKWGK